MGSADDGPALSPRNRRGRGRWIPLGLGLLAAISLLLEYGFRLDGETERLLEGLDLVLAGLFGAELLGHLLLSGAGALRRRWHEVLLLVLFLFALPAAGWLLPDDALGELLGTLRVRSAARLYLVAVQAYIFFDFLVLFVRGQQALLAARIPPERLFAGSFAGLVAVGTGLLLLPRASADPETPISVLDALFTSTSAVCVTGLAVRDTGADFALFGQFVIGLLFQVGGLGIITFVAVLSFSSKGAFSVPQMVALREVVNAPSLGDVRRHVMVIAVTAIVIETVGAVSLFLAAPVDTGVAERILSALFHSVSAFCNAGFALQSDSFVSRSGHPLTNVTLMGLIVIGGLGAPVVREVVVFVHGRFVKHEKRKKRLSAQSRLSLWMTGFLILGGALAYLALEWKRTLAGTGVMDHVLVPLFQSVTTRTAGFNTADIGALSEPTLLVMIVLMVIGACPVSTGGGVKAVAIGILLLTLRSMITGRPVEIFGRRVPERVVRSSISLFLLYLAGASLTMFILSLTDGDLPAVGRAFETVSALSTVGLSTGITAEFSAAGKVVLCLAMFIGRVGPLTLAMTVFRGKARAPYDLPEEAMVVG